MSYEQAAVRDEFSSVLAPGTNVYPYDNNHVDFMRRHDGHRACNPHAVSGEEVAARAARYAGKRDRGITGSPAPPRPAARPFEGPPARAPPPPGPGGGGADGRAASV